MFLRNLVLVTLLAASSASSDGIPCAEKKYFDPKCITQEAYNNCNARLGQEFFTQNWYNNMMPKVLERKRKADYNEVKQEAKDQGISLYNLSTEKQKQMFGEQRNLDLSACSTSPAVCLLSQYEEEARTGVRYIFFDGKDKGSAEIDCFKIIAVHECMLENKGRKNPYRMGFGVWHSMGKISQNPVDDRHNTKGEEEKFAEDLVDRTIQRIRESGTTPYQCRARENALTNMEAREPYLQGIAQLQAYRGAQQGHNKRKTIETVKNPQQTTGSSDNTVLIVVVALLSVFALAVGVWVGRLSSEMKIPQDAQLGPVTVETV